MAIYRITAEHVVLAKEMRAKGVSVCDCCPVWQAIKDSVPTGYQCSVTKDAIFLRNEEGKYRKIPLPEQKITRMKDWDEAVGLTFKVKL